VDPVYRPVKARLDKLVKEKCESFNKIENFQTHLSNAPAFFNKLDEISSGSENGEPIEIRAKGMFDNYKSKKYN
jgi:hypothetical protein